MEAEYLPKACVCVRARACACVRACVCGCVCVWQAMEGTVKSLRANGRYLTPQDRQ